MTHTTHMARRNLGVRRSILLRARLADRTVSVLSTVSAVSVLTGTVVDLFGLFGLASPFAVLAGGLIRLIGVAGLLPRGRWRGLSEGPGRFTG